MVSFCRTSRHKHQQYQFEIHSTQLVESQNQESFLHLCYQDHPTFICWEIWRTRCSNKYEAKKPSAYKSVSNILFNILQVLNKKFGKAIFGDNWTTICQACDYNIHQKDVIIVKWIRPHFDTLKLDSDGSCVNGICGGGGNVRDSARKIIFAYSIPLGPGTRKYVEATAMMYGLKWCSTHDSRTIWGETDSLLLTNYINKVWKPHG